MQFGMLGPLEVVYRGRRIDLGRPEQRALLALLLIHANRVVSLDRLIDELWGEELRRGRRRRCRPTSPIWAGP